jgi:hypothetical protein
MNCSSVLIRGAGRLLAGLLLFGGLAPAATIIATGVDWNRGANIWINADGTNEQTYFAGVIFITLTTPDGQTYNRDSLCVDLFTDIYLGQTYASTVVSPDDVSGKNLNRVSWLIDNALLPTQPTGPSPTSALPQADWVTNSAQGAGIQLAIWDIVHDGGDGFASGLVQASTDPNNPTDPAVLNWAQTYETASFGQSSNTAYIYSNVDMGSGQPAQMLAGPEFLDGGPTPPGIEGFPAPEPSTFVLSGVALIAVSLCLRKRARRAQARIA